MLDRVQTVRYTACIMTTALPNKISSNALDKARIEGQAISVFMYLDYGYHLEIHSPDDIRMSNHRATAYPDGTVELVHRDAEGNFVRLEVMA